MGIRWLPIGCHGKKIIKKKKQNARNLKRETFIDMGILAI